MSKQDKQKAQQLGKKYQTPCHGIGDCEFEAYQSALEMAEWKEQQLIEKAAKWLKENAGMYWYDDIYIDCPAELLEDFKNAMKGIN